MSDSNKTLIELAKIKRDSDLETTYKALREDVRNTMTTYIVKAGNGAFEKHILQFANTKYREGQLEFASIVDILENVVKGMDRSVSGYSQLDDAGVVTRVNKYTMVELEKLTGDLLYYKTNFFPLYKEKYEYGTTEEAEAKNVILQHTIRRLKQYLEQYVYTYRLGIKNDASRQLHDKFVVCRDHFASFEYNYYRLVKRTEEEKVRSRVSYLAEIKLILLRMRKFLEALNESSFGISTKRIFNLGKEFGVHAYARHYPAPQLVITKHKSSTTPQVVQIAEILRAYKAVMAPMMSAVNTYKVLKSKAEQQRDGTQPKEVYWNVSETIDASKKDLGLLISEISSSLPNDDKVCKNFIFMLQNVLIPYYGNRSGKACSSFVSKMEQTEMFFWDAIFSIIGRTIEAGTSYEELLGLEVREEQAKELIPEMQK